MESIEEEELHRNFMPVFLEKKTQFSFVFLFSSKFLSPSLHLVFKRGISTMIGGFMRNEPTNSTRLHEHPQVVAIFTREN